MITETREIYKCDHCRKLYQIKGACEKHEKVCYKNPENDRACLNCLHCDMKQFDLTVFDHNGYDSKVKANAIFCDKIQSFLIPPKAEHKGNAYQQEDLNDGELPNVLMPRKCEYSTNN